MFWDNYEKLCAEAGEAPAEIAVKCGVKSTGTVPAWKKGSMPRPVILKNIAEYFGITVAELIGDKPAAPAQKEKPTAVKGDELAELIKLYTDADPTLRIAALAVLKSAEFAPSTQDV